MILRHINSQILFSCKLTYGILNGPIKPKVGSDSIYFIKYKETRWFNEFMTQ